MQLPFELKNQLDHLALYPNNMKNREFDKEAPQIFCSEGATIAQRQGASENKKFEAKPTRSKTDSSCCLGINVSLSEWTRAFQKLSDLYRSKHVCVEQLNSEVLRLAYLHVRLPATYAVLVRVLNEVEPRLPGITIKTMSDIGAGPGTGLWAASGLFGLKQVVCYERDEGFIALGKRLSLPLHGISIQWTCGDVTRVSSLEQRDLVLASYSLGEMEASSRSALLRRLWESTAKVLVIVEPGTPQGFAEVRTMREELIALGGYVIAPCPHQEACPMKAGDWCHFSQRIERSSLHRRIKGGSLNYEDEKFSYIIVSREPGLPISGRILRHPQKHAGFITAEVCGPTGIQQITTTRKEKEAYKRMRKSEWGDFKDC